MRKLFIATGIALIAASSFAAELVEGIVVRVGDRIITRTQYEHRLEDAYRDINQTETDPAKAAAMRAQARTTLVNELVSELLLKDRADRLGITVTDADVKEGISRLKQQYNIQSDEQFDRSLKQSGMNRADMEARLRDTLLTNKVFAKELHSREEATDAELRERYNREKEHYRLPERAHLREIVILKPESGSSDTARQKAIDVAEAAKKPGTDFSKLASTMSDASTRDQGGELGEVAKGDLVPELDAAVFNAASGAIVGPIETKSGWHIVKVEQRLPSEVPAFESVKEKLRKDASEETFQRDYKAYIENLRKDAFVQINDAMIPKS